MQEIVINTDFGGFGLSPEGEKEYCKRKFGKDVFFYHQTKYKYTDGINEYEKIKDFDGGHFLAHSILKDLGEVITELPEKDDIWFSDYTLPRNDECLVAVVKDLGERANGSCAHLKVVAIPDEVQWHIAEYDGMEHVAENHRTWR